MQPINVNGDDLPVKIVHGIVIKSLHDPTKVVFRAMNELSKEVRNVINCGCPASSKGEKANTRYQLFFNGGEIMFATETKPAKDQWRRGTLAFVTDPSNNRIYAALTVYNPDDNGKINYTKRAGRWSAYRKLRYNLLDRPECWASDQTGDPGCFLAIPQSGFITEYLYPRLIEWLEKRIAKDKEI